MKRIFLIALIFAAGSMWESAEAGARRICLGNSRGEAIIWSPGISYMTMEPGGANCWTASQGIPARLVVLMADQRLICSTSLYATGDELVTIVDDEAGTPHCEIETEPVPPPQGTQSMRFHFFSKRGPMKLTLCLGSDHCTFLGEGANWRKDLLLPRSMQFLVDDGASTQFVWCDFAYTSYHCEGGTPDHRFKISADPRSLMLYYPPP